jgi:hypothetical protein
VIAAPVHALVELDSPGRAPLAFGAPRAVIEAVNALRGWIETRLVP